MDVGNCTIVQNEQKPKKKNVNYVILVSKINLLTQYNFMYTAAIK